MKRILNNGKYIHKIGPIPNPQSPIPNPQSPSLIEYRKIIFKNNLNNNLKINFLHLISIFQWNK